MRACHGAQWDVGQRPAPLGPQICRGRGQWLSWAAGSGGLGAVGAAHAWEKHSGQTLLSLQPPGKDKGAGERPPVQGRAAGQLWLEKQGLRLPGAASVMPNHRPPLSRGLSGLGFISITQILESDFLGSSLRSAVSSLSSPGRRLPSSGPQLLLSVGCGMGQTAELPELQRHGESVCVAAWSPGTVAALCPASPPRCSTRLLLSPGRCPPMVMSALGTLSPPQRGMQGCMRFGTRMQAQLAESLEESDLAKLFQNPLIGLACSDLWFQRPCSRPNPPRSGGRTGQSPGSPRPLSLPEPHTEQPQLRPYRPRGQGMGVSQEPSALKGFPEDPEIRPPHPRGLPAGAPRGWVGRDTLGDDAGPAHQRTTGVREPPPRLRTSVALSALRSGQVDRDAINTAD